MPLELMVAAVGETSVAFTGLVLGVMPLQRWRRTGSRVILHWPIMFLSAMGYLLGALIILGHGNPATLTRLHYLAAAAAVFPGALAATILMLPIPSEWGDRVSPYLPLGLFIVSGVFLLLSPLLSGPPHEVWNYVGFLRAAYVALVMIAGPFSAATLLYLTARLKIAGYLIMATAFLLITVGGRLVGGNVINLALAEVVLAACYVMFYILCMALMRAE